MRSFAISPCGWNAIKKMPLRVRMIIGGVVSVIIPLVIVGIANFYYVSSSLEAITNEKSTLVAKSLASLIQTSLKGEMKIVTTLAVEPQIIKTVAAGRYDKTLALTIKTIFENVSSDLEGAFITDKNGIIRVDSADAGRRGLNLSDREYFLQAKAGRATVSGPVASKATGDPIIVVAAPIMDRNRFVGVLAKAFKTEYLLGCISSVKLGKTGYTFMIDRNGLVIVHPRKEYILKRNIFSTTGIENIAKRMIAQQTGTEEYVFEGQRKMAGFAPIAITGWSVALTQNREEFLAPAHAIVRNVMILLPLALLLTAVIGIMVVRGISQPILDLSKAAGGLADGKWQQIRDTGRGDELGEVIRSFNAMSERLQALFVSLEESEARYRRIVDTASEGIWVFGPDRKTTFVNTKMAQMLGYEVADIIGRPLSDYMFPEDASDHNDRMAKRQLGISEPHERCLRTKNGGTLWTIVSETTSLDSDGRITGAFAMLTDITARKQAENELVLLNQELERRVSLRTAELASRTAELECSLIARDEAEAMLNRLYVAIESGPTAVVIADAEQLVVYANPAAETLSGYSLQDVLGRSLWMVFDLSEQPHVMGQAMESISSGRTWRAELHCIRKDGGGAWVDISLSGILDERGAVASFVGVLNDITEKHELQRHLTDLSYRDGLTGVSNRRQFDKRLAEEWRRCSRRNSPLSLIMVDMDYFKLYNDTYGHLGGDECLRKVAGCIENSAQRRAGDLVARYGGEEFVALLPDTGAGGAYSVAEATRVAVETMSLPHPASPFRNHVTVSIGIACTTPASDGDPNDLVSRADRMLYQAKSTGRNKVCVEPEESG